MKLADLEWIKPLLEGIEQGRILQVKNVINEWSHAGNDLVFLLTIGHNKNTIRLEPAPKKVKVYVYKTVEGKYFYRDLKANYYRLRQITEQGEQCIEEGRLVGEGEIEVKE